MVKMALEYSPNNFFVVPIQVQRYDKERKEANMLLGTEYTHYAFDYFFDKVHELGDEKGSLDDSISDDEVED